MQVKKEEVHRAIIETALSEFMENGYQRTSLRKIASKAGTTLGNIYNYFDSKEALFSHIVDQPYNQLKSLASSHGSISKNDDIWEVSDVLLWRTELENLMTQFLPMITSQFIILIEGSGGTKYEHARGEIARYLSYHFMDHIREYNPDYRNHELADIFSNQLIDGMIRIVKSYPDIETQKRLITDYLIFFAIGTMGILTK